jgi:dTDP-4-amino-4,6-dideoxygalactose transaminase
MKVPFLDLKIQYLSIKDEIDLAIKNVIEKTAFAGGPFVQEFEENFAIFCNTKHAVGVGSGTSALWLSLMGLGIGPGDEVITVPNTFIATVEAISLCGAKPVFVDVDEKTYTIDPELIEAAITSKTRAIIPVHLFGQMCDMDPIMHLANKHNLFVIEDACQAHGAEYKGKKAGSIGVAGCFSFYPGKNLGAAGEAGAVVTNRSDLKDKITSLRDHGQVKKYHHDMIGWNARMDGIQGAILSVKLKYLPEWNEARRNNAKRYNELLQLVDDIILPQEIENRKHIYHLYVLRVRNRDKLVNHLAGKNIYCGIHYPIPIHQTNAYKHLNIDERSLPITEKCARELISLPMYPELSSEQINYVAEEIKKIL